VARNGADPQAKPEVGQPNSVAQTGLRSLASRIRFRSASIACTIGLGLPAYGWIAMMSNSLFTPLTRYRARRYRLMETVPDPPRGRRPASTTLIAGSAWRAASAVSWSSLAY
jgi:hypothetical protein